MEKLSPSFVTSLNAALAFWKQRFASEAPIRLDVDRHNLYRAVQFGLEFSGTQRSAAQVATAAFPFIFARGYWQEWLPVMEKAVSVSPSVTTETRFWLLTRLGQIRRLNRRLGDALQVHCAALEMAQRLGEPILIAEAHYHLGRALRDACLYAKAETQLFAGAHILEQMMDDSARSLAAHIYNALGRVAEDRGRVAEARTHLERAVALAKAHDHPARLADYVHDLGNAHRASGAYERALACYEEALALLAGTGYRHNRAQIHLSLGALHFARHDFIQAESVFRQIDMPFLRETGNLHLQAMTLTSLGNALLYQKRYDESVQVLRECASLWRQLEDELELANAVGSLGEALAGFGNDEEATAMFSEALVLLERFPDSAKAGRLRALFTAEQEKVAGRMDHYRDPPPRHGDAVNIRTNRWSNTRPS